MKRRPSLGLLPPELLTAKAVHFTERVSDVLTATDSELSTNAGAVVMDAVRRLGVFRGWRSDFMVGGGLRFTIRRRKRLLVFDGLQVVDATGAALGEFRQRPTGFSVRFDVLDGAGRQRLEVYQPGSEHRSFDVLGPKGRVAVLTRLASGRDTSSHRLRKGSVVDAFDAFFEGPLDELDRVLCLSAAVFADRLYASNGDSTTDRVLESLLSSRQNKR